MENELNRKYQLLIKELEKYGSLAVAFSGGVDSTFLAKVAFDTLGAKALAITVDSEAYPPENIRECRKLADQIGIRLTEIKKTVCDIPEFSENHPDRCYHCKKALFNIMLKRAEEEGIHILSDGSNHDDIEDYRPGIRALDELNIKSPLRDLGFAKNDIRILSKDLGLPTWNSQPFACLASRFSYGTRITPELLEKIWKDEAMLRDLGIKYYRVRHHGDIARIELDPKGMDILMNKSIRGKIVNHMKSLGYIYITLDLKGYRTGSMNEVLNDH